MAVIAILSSTGCCLEIASGISEEDAGDKYRADSGIGCSSGAGAAVYACSDTDLYKIDPVTWMPILVGSFETVPPDGITDLAISSSNEIYATSNSALYRINPSDGAATGLMSYNTGFNAMTFLAGGTLLGVAADGAVSSVDPTRQSVSYIGSYGPDYGSSGDLVAVADGTIYATSPISPVMSGIGDSLVKVDPGTGLATTVGSIGFTNVWGLAYYDGTVIGFTSGGQILEIDPATGTGKLVGSSSVSYFGAAVTPAVAPRCP